MSKAWSRLQIATSILLIFALSGEAGLPGVPAAPGCQGGARHARGLGPGGAGAGRPNPKSIPMCRCYPLGHGASCVHSFAPCLAYFFHLIGWRGAAASPALHTTWICNLRTHPQGGARFPSNHSLGKAPLFSHIGCSKLDVIGRPAAAST